MPRNGSGTFNLAEPPFVPLTIIDAGDMNNVLSDIGVALTQSFSRDGQTIATGAWNLGNFRITNLATPILTNDAATKGYVDGRTAWEVIGTTAATATANIDFTWNSGIYRAIEIILTGILPASSGASVNLLARARRSGAYVSGASDYTTLRNVVNNVGVGGGQLVSSAWALQDDGTNASLDPLTGRLTLDLGDSGDEPGLIGITRYSGFTGGRRSAALGCSMTPGAVDGLRFLWEGGGNFAAVGRIMLLGLRADAAVGGVTPALVIFTIATTTHTPTLAQANGYLRCTNGSGCAITIPTNANVAYPVGTVLTFEQAGAAAVTIAGDTGVTVRVPAAYDPETADQYAVVQAAKVAADEWVLYGNLAPA